MKKLRVGAVTVLLMGLVSVMPIKAAYGPGVNVAGGPGYATPTRLKDVYLYPGFKGKGPDMFGMINSFLSTEWDEEDYEDEYYHYDKGWHYSPDGWWYLCEDGSWPAGGWRCIDARWYYFTQKGHVQTGWLQDSGNWFYLNPVDDGSYGAMRTGWQIVGGKAYYFNASRDGVYGAMLVNTITPDGYRVGADGAMILQ